MTAHTPAPKASGVSALLASFSTVPPPPKPSVKEDFLAVMLHALIGGPDSADHSAPAQPTQQKPAQATAPDPTSASLLLALLAPAPPKSPSNKASVPDDPSVSAAQAAQEKSSLTEAVPDLTAVSLLMALLAPPLFTVTRPPSHKGSAPPGPVVLSVPAEPPAPTPTASEPKSAKTDAAEKAPSLLAQSLSTKEPQNTPPPISGTSAANLSQRMNFSPERNEIAGRMEQKVPPAGISAVSSANTGGFSPDGGGKSSLTFSWHDAPSEPLAIIELSAKAAFPAVTVVDTIMDAPARAASATPLERLEHMISREAVSVRQAGAQTLGVTLKLDSNTQLFLQLTTHNGMVQASVRCERGNFAPEDAQWAQLQQSLARQNVQLQPMTGGSNLNFQHPSEQRSRQQAARENWPAPDVAVPPAPPRQQKKEQNRSRKNWETWA